MHHCDVTACRNKSGEADNTGRNRHRSGVVCGGPVESRDNRITTTLLGDNTFGNYIYNSMNHRGRGQNVGFGDDHVSWNTNPYCGAHHDNIFTYYRHEYTSHGDSAAAPQAGLSELGNAAAVPTILGSKPDYDICMVPVRNGSQYGKKMRRW